MQSKESLIVLYCLNKILNGVSCDYQPGHLINWLDSVSIDLFGEELKELLNTSTPSASLTISKYQKAQNDVQFIKRHIARMKLLNIFTPKFDSKMKCLTDTFGLFESNAKNLLRLLFYKEKYPMLDRVIKEISCSGLNKASYKDIEIYAAICDCSPMDITEQLSFDAPLSQMGLINVHADNHIVLSGVVARLMNSKATTITQMKKISLGEPTKAKLTPKNFSHLNEDFKYISGILKKATQQNLSGINILIYGPTGNGKTELAKTICHAINCRLYSLERRLNGNLSHKTMRLPELARAQRLLNNDNKAIILMDEAEDIFSSGLRESAPTKIYLNRLLETNTRPVIWITNNVADMDRAYIRRFQYALEVTKAKECDRIQIWKNICQKHHMRLSNEQIEHFSNQYDLAPAIIESAVHGAQLIETPTALEKMLNNFQHVMTGQKTIQNKDTSTPFSTELLHTDTDLKLLCRRICETRNTSFSMCLYGASGTGKSAYARYLAEQLQMKIIQKRVSDLSSKYVGETEANIAKAFQEAEHENAILVFDEADSFLRKRENAHNAWEVTAVNELLTQMENCTIPFICTTNLMSTIDSASLRRFTFKIKYSFLTEQQIGRAFQHFFGIKPSRSLAALTHLAPGDFSVVSNRAKILGISDEETLITMLTEEMEAKGISTTHFGFNI